MIRERGDVHPLLAAAAAVGLAALLFWLTPALGDDYPRWELDAELTGRTRGASGWWHDKLWGLDHNGYRIWTYDGTTFGAGGQLPQGFKPFRALFTDQGMFVIAREPHVTGPASLHLLRSPDGLQNFQILLSRDVVQSATLEHSLVDLGQGRLLYVDYGNGDELFYSPDNGDSWRVLFAPNQRAVSHFHGAFYDQPYDKLYLMSGDNNDASSIMVTTDVFGPNGLIQDPQLWATRWGLVDDLRSTLDPEYVLDPDGILTSQRSRAVDMIALGDYVYWGEDASSALGQAVFRVHRQTQVVEQVGERGLVTAPWNWMTASDGRLLLTTASIHYRDQIVPGHDQYVRLLAFNQDATQYQEIARFARAEPYYDTAEAVGFVEAFDRIWIYGAQVPQDGFDIVGRLVYDEPSGDLNGDLLVDVADIELISAALRDGQPFEPKFDINQDSAFNSDDRLAYIHDVLHTWLGDANLDGYFASNDLVLVMQEGEYEDQTAGNSTWADGDWDGDADFTSKDLITAIADGGYEGGPRMAVQAIPEPAARLLICMGLMALAARRGAVAKHR
jgi:hypothetical protein